MHVHVIRRVHDGHCNSFIDELKTILQSLTGTPTNQRIRLGPGTDFGHGPNGLHRIVADGRLG